MSTLIFDIETVGEDFDSFDETTQASLTRWVRREPLAEQERLLGEVKNGLGLSPLTGRILLLVSLMKRKGRGRYILTHPRVTFLSAKRTA